MPEPTLSPYHHRLTALQEAIETSDLDGIILNPGSTLYFLTGLDFHLMERPVLLFIGAQGAPRMVLPALEKMKLNESPYPIKADTYGEDPDTWPAKITGILGGDVSRLGGERRGLRFLETDLISQAAPQSTLVAADALIARIRGRKDRAEIEKMRRAVAVAETALRATLQTVRGGMTERELSDELIIQLLRAGSTLDLPFAPIVSFGENSANPHASPGARQLREGDLVLIDWGARVDGYVSDLTRVFAYGDVPEKLRDIARIVEKANLAAQAVSRAGVTVEQVDHAARSVIEQAGYGDAFVHRTGHGLGLEAHEEPYIRAGNDSKLEVGHAFTIEPGIYLENLGGVRIEDDVVVTEDGIEVLGTLPRELVSIG